MKPWMMLAAPFLLASATTGEAAMPLQTFLGTTVDGRVTRCGINIEGDRVATLSPFIDASTDLQGKYRIDLMKRSGSGTGMMSQSNKFRGGGLGSARLTVDRPASLSVSLLVQDDDGKPLCRMDTKFELPAASVDDV